MCMCSNVPWYVVHVRRGADAGWSQGHSKHSAPLRASRTHSLGASVQVAQRIVGWDEHWGRAVEFEVDRPFAPGVLTDEGERLALNMSMTVLRIVVLAQGSARVTVWQMRLRSASRAHGALSHPCSARWLLHVMCSPDGCLRRQLRGLTSQDVRGRLLTPGPRAVHSLLNESISRCGPHRDRLDVELVL